MKTCQSAPLSSIIILFFTLFTIPIFAEICDNGIDDDGDGLIDLNDPDCNCSGVPTTQVPFALPNPSFESKNCCPDAHSQMSCVDDWYMVGGTSDYFNTCDFSTMAPFATAQPPLDGDGFVGFFDRTSNEYVGTCLTTPLPAGTYTVEFDLAHGGMGSAPPYPSTEIAIYGSASCGSTFSCSSLGDFSLLGSATTDNTTGGDWATYSFTLNSSFDVNSLVIGPDCNSGVTSGYYYLDNVNIFSEVSSVSISQIGGTCTDKIELHANISGGFDFQWYKDGVALVGATSYEYTVAPGESGDYTLLISDGTDCALSNVISVDAEFLELDITSTDLLCFDAADGTIDVQIPIGTGPFTYTWSGGHTGSSLNGLSAGVYSLTVEGATCQIDTVIELEEPTPIEVVFNIQDESGCSSDDGEIQSTISGGAGAPYSIVWSNGETSADITGLAGGSYTITVTDGDGCEIENTASVLSVSAPTFSSLITDVSCNGGNDGVIEIVPDVAGTYTYDWDGGVSSSATASSLSSGTYEVTVSDGSGCSEVMIHNLSEPLALTLTEVLTDNSDCETPNGAIQTTVSGGAGPYVFGWSDGSSDEDLMGISQGNYDVTVTDANGCSLMQSFTLNGVVVPTVQVIQNDPLCFGESSGSIDLTVTPSGTYTYMWSDVGLSGSNPTNLAAGSYVVTVDDGSSCTVTKTVVLNDPLEIKLDDVSSDATVCGYADGSIQISTNGGVAPFSYNWNNGSTSNEITGIESGSYTITVTDAQGCSATRSVNIQYENEIAATYLANDVLCYGEANGEAEVQVTTGTGPFEIVWPDGVNSQDRNDLPSGNYVVEITDAQNCATEVEVQIEEPQPLYAKEIIDHKLCNRNYGEIELGVSGGSSPYAVDWNKDHLSGVEIQKLDSGEYIYSIVDANGCELEGTIEIKQKYPEDYANEIFSTGDSRQVPAIYHFQTALTVLDWQVGSELFTEQELQYTFTEPGEHQVEVRTIDYTGCLDTQEVVIDLLGSNQVYVPNAFTPNDNQLNDEFKVVAADAEDFQILIFNRWGDKVFESNSLNQGWDGTWNDKKCPMDVYSYVVEIRQQDKPKHLYGKVALVR